MYVRVPRSLVLQQLCSPPATFASYQSCCTEAAARFHGRKLSWHRSQGAQRIFSAGSAQKVLASSKGLLGKFREASTQEWWMLCWCARAVLCPWDISKAALKQHMRNAVAPGLGWSPGTLQQEQTRVVAVRVTRPCPLPTKPGHRGLWTAPLRIRLPHSCLWHICRNVPAMENFFLILPMLIVWETFCMSANAR